MKKTFVGHLAHIVSGLFLSLLVFFTAITPVFALGTVAISNVPDGVVFDGTGFTGISEVSIQITRTDNSAGHGSGSITVSTGGAFVYTDVAAVSGITYTYSVTDTATGDALTTGSFTAGGTSSTGTGTSTTGGGTVSTGGGAQVSTGDGAQVNTDNGEGISNINFVIPNPVTAFDNLPDLLVELLKIVMLIASPIIAVMLIYTGYLFVTARGDTNQIKTARDMLKYTVIGAAIILGAEIIAKAIQATVSSLT